MVLMVLGSSNLYDCGLFREEKKNPEQLLVEIHKEVSVFDFYEKSNFIKKEFFIGEDDDDTNKDIHAVVVIQENDGRRTMNIQVTTMRRVRSNPTISYAHETKCISCFIDDGSIRIKKSDFENKDIHGILTGLLKAIADKKKLLDKKDNPWP